MAEQQIGYGAGGKSFKTGKKTIPIEDYKTSFPGQPTDEGLTEAKAGEGYAFYLNPQTGKYERKLDTGIYEEEMGLLGETVGALEKQVGAAEKAIGAAQEAGTASQRAARLKAAQALSSYRGLGEGGRGVGLSQMAAQTAGVTEAGILADTAAAVAAREGEATEARTSATIAKKKLLEQEKAYEQEAIDAASDAQETVNRIGGPMRTTADDVKKILEEIRSKQRAATSPKAKAAYQKIIDSIYNGTFDGPGIDTWSKSDL